MARIIYKEGLENQNRRAEVEGQPGGHHRASRSGKPGGEVCFKIHLKVR